MKIAGNKIKKPECQKTDGLSSVVIAIATPGAPRARRWSVTEAGVSLRAPLPLRTPRSGLAPCHRLHLRGAAYIN